MGDLIIKWYLELPFDLYGIEGRGPNISTSFLEDRITFDRFKNFIQLSDFGADTLKTHKAEYGGNFNCLS